MYNYLNEKDPAVLVEKLNGTLYSTVIPKEGLDLDGKTLTFTAPAAGGVAFAAASTGKLLKAKEIIDQVIAEGITGLHAKLVATPGAGHTGSMLALWVDTGASIVITDTPAATALGWDGGRTQAPIPSNSIVGMGDGFDYHYVIYTA